jgi:hypothetical protein
LEPCCQQGSRREVDARTRPTLEDPDAQLLCLTLGILVDCDVEAEDDRQFGSTLEHGGAAHDILPVDRADVDTGDRNLDRIRLEEFEQSLERSERRSLNKDTASGSVDRVEEVGQVRHDLLAQLIFVVILGANEQSRTSDGLLEIRRDNLDTHSRLDLLVVDVLTLRGEKNVSEQGATRSGPLRTVTHLDSKLLHRLRPQSTILSPSCR